MRGASVESPSFYLAARLGSVQAVNAIRPRLTATAARSAQVAAGAASSEMMLVGLDQPVGGRLADGRGRPHSLRHPLAQVND